MFNGLNFIYLFLNSLAHFIKITLLEGKMVILTGDPMRGGNKGHIEENKKMQ